MATNFVYNPKVEYQLARQAQMVAVMAAFAARGAASARGLAPVHTGDYRASIGSAAGLVNGRATGRVLSTDFFAHGIEKGSVNNPAYAPLRRGVEATGLPVRAGRRR